MPPTPRHALRRRLLPLLAGGVLCLVAIGAGLAMLKPSKPTPGPATTAPSVAAHAPSATATGSAPQAAAAARTQEPLLDARQWAQLQQSLASHPHADAEVARIIELLAYQRSVQQFRTERMAGAGTPPSPTLAALARRIDDGLNARIAQGEVSGPEAQRLKAALLEVLEPDTARRAEALADWRQDQLAAHPPQTDPRDAQLLQAQQALVARWRREGPAHAAPDALVAQLEALRQRIYASPSTNQGKTP